MWAPGGHVTGVLPHLVWHSGSLVMTVSKSPSSTAQGLKSIAPLPKTPT